MTEYLNRVGPPMEAVDGELSEANRAAHELARATLARARAFDAYRKATTRSTLYERQREWEAACRREDAAAKEYQRIAKEEV